MNAGYFDYNATTPLRPEAQAAWIAANNELWLNPSSPYRAAARVHVRLEEARAGIADLFGVEPGRVIFNSGATEGNNSIFAHWAFMLPADARIAISPTEHPSVLEPARYYFAKRIDWLQLTAGGAVDLLAFKRLLDSKTIRAVSVMAANNETGVLNDWLAIAEECRAREIPYHCDASQWVGKLPLQGLGLCNFVTGCAHKFGGACGVGFLILPEVHSAFKALLGGVQESGHRAGTENVAGILAMVAALRSADPGTAEGRDAFIDRLAAKLPAVTVVGSQAKRLWNTVQLILPEFESSRWIRALEKRGFMVASGSACSTGQQGPSKVLSAMGLDAHTTRRALRISSGWATRLQDWLNLADALVECYETLRADSENSSAAVISI